MATLNGQVYSVFNKTEDVVSDTQAVSTGLWSAAIGTLSTAFTSSAQTASTGQYYIDVYNVATSSTTVVPEVQFSIAYGNYAGSGSLKLNEQYPSRALYMQFKSLLLSPGTASRFSFNGVNKDHALFIALERPRFKEKLDIGSWQLSISGSNGKIYTMFDNSSISGGQTLQTGGRVFNIISGSAAGEGDGDRQ
jgi:hypothetical protein